MKKIDREVVYLRYGGRCAYCGQPIERKGFQVDHIIPKERWHQHRALILLGESVDDLQNLNPSCRVCNNWKHSHELEEFRKEIARQTERARQYSRNFRMAERFGLVKEVIQPVKFYFESVLTAQKARDGK